MGKQNILNFIFKDVLWIWHLVTKNKKPATTTNSSTGGSNYSIHPSAVIEYFSSFSTDFFKPRLFLTGRQLEMRALNEIDFPITEWLFSDRLQNLWKNFSTGSQIYGALFISVSNMRIHTRTCFGLGLLTFKAVLSACNPLLWKVQTIWRV